jgi:hypothetical protein
MTLTPTRHSESPADESEALFREAKLRRRRRRLGLVLLLILVGAGVATVVSHGGGGRSGGPHRSTSPGRSPKPPPGAPASTGQAGTAGVTLPRSTWINQVVVIDGHLDLTGQMASKGGNGPCGIASVNPTTLKIGHWSTGSCGDPRLEGEQADVAVSYDQSDDNASLAITQVDPTTNAVTTSPAVMRFTHSSDTNPVTAYGPGTLWVYDAASSNGPEVIDYSTSSDRVVSIVPAPPLYRPLLAADADGLWMGNSLSGSSSPDVLYHLAPGATQVTGAMGGDNLIAYWLDASGHSVWAGIGPTYQQQTIWRFNGPDATPAFHTPDHGYDPGNVIGGETHGLWATVPLPSIGNGTAGSNRYDAVLRIDPNTGNESVIAKLSPLTNLEAENQVLGVRQDGALFHGSLYLLKPPFRVRGYLGYSELVRITP